MKKLLLIFFILIASNSITFAQGAIAHYCVDYRIQDEAIAEVIKRIYNIDENDLMLYSSRTAGTYFDIESNEFSNRMNLLKLFSSGQKNILFSL